MLAHNFEEQDRLIDRLPAERGGDEPERTFWGGRVRRRRRLLRWDGLSWSRCGVPGVGASVPAPRLPLRPAITALSAAAPPPPTPQPPSSPRSHDGVARRQRSRCCASAGRLGSSFGGSGGPTCRVSLSALRSAHRVRACSPGLRSAGIGGCPRAGTGKGGIISSRRNGLRSPPSWPRCCCCL